MSGIVSTAINNCTVDKILSIDLTPRRMNNFTPGQLMSLKTEFCFVRSFEHP